MSVSLAKDPNKPNRCTPKDFIFRLCLNSIWRRSALLETDNFIGQIYPLFNKEAAHKGGLF